MSDQDTHTVCPQRGTGIRHRLQGMLPSAEPQLDAFDPGFWQQASTLTWFGFELYVRSGAVTISLRHRHPDGHETEIAHLDCPFPGSQFSPPLELAAFARAGGDLLPVIIAQSENAEFDAYFGTNDIPPLPDASAVIHSQPEGQGALRRLSYQLAYGTEPADPATLRDIPTHLALVSTDQPLSAEGRNRCQVLARFLRPDAVLHRARAHPSAHLWPIALLDLTLIYRHGLPGGDLSAYMGQLEHQGVTRAAPLSPAPAITAAPAGGRIARLLRRPETYFPRPPAPQIVRLRHTQAEQARQFRAQLTQTRQQLETHLQQNRLWDRDQVASDQNRASQIALSLLRNRHPGQRAVVIGNGPSLRVSDLERLRDTVTFGSNKIYLAYEDTSWRPTYYSVEDHLVLLNNRARIEDLTGSIKLFPDNMRLFGYHAGDTIFAPFLPPASFEDPLADPEFPAFSHDLSQGLAWGSTITYSQIQMAAFMGCTEIILIGVDHSYQLPSVKQGNRYIYEGERNHFHPEYRATGEAWHQPNLDVLERSYHKARSVCDAAGIRILNASRHSKLTVFERADFDQLFPTTGETP